MRDKFPPLRLFMLLLLLCAFARAQKPLRILDVGDSHLASREANTLGKYTCDALRVPVDYLPVGSIGACMSDLTSSLRAGRGRYPVEAMKRFAPQVILLSFGSNEANQYADPNRTTKEVAECFDEIRRDFGDVLIILIGPPDGRLPYLDAVIAGLRASSDAYMLPFIDRRTLMGGSRSFARWEALRLARQDGVHLTVDGYESLNKLLAPCLAAVIRK